MTSSSGSAPKNPILPYKRLIQSTGTWTQLPAGVSCVCEAVKCSRHVWCVATGPLPSVSLRGHTPIRQNEQTRKKKIQTGQGLRTGECSPPLSFGLPTQGTVRLARAPTAAHTEMSIQQGQGIEIERLILHSGPATRPNNSAAIRRSCWMPNTHAEVASCPCLAACSPPPGPCPSPAKATSVQESDGYRSCRKRLLGV